MESYLNLERQNSVRIEQAFAITFKTLEMACRCTIMAH